MTRTCRLVESDEDILLYDIGHIPGAINVDWHSELQHQVRARLHCQRRLWRAHWAVRAYGNDHTVVFYGDRNNWWACYTFWVFKLYGHVDCRIMNGGRQKWLDEGRELTQERPAYPATTYTASGPDLAIRAFRQEVLEHMQARKPLIDVRSPGEYSGELLHMPITPRKEPCAVGTFQGPPIFPGARL